MRMWVFQYHLSVLLSKPILEGTRFYEEKIKGKKKGWDESREHVRLVLHITVRYICVRTESATKVEGSQNGRGWDAEDSNNKKEKQRKGRKNEYGKNEENKNANEADILYERKILRK